MDDEDFGMMRSDDPVVLAGRQDLDPLSQHELDERIARLEAEIERTRAHRDRASAHRNAADSLFKR